jgi:hypothetical protein
MPTDIPKKTEPMRVMARDGAINASPKTNIRPAAPTALKPENKPSSNPTGKTT